MEYLIVFILGLVLGAYFTSIFDRWIFGQLLDRLGIKHQQLNELYDKLSDELDPPATAAQIKQDLPIRLEQHNGVIYAYRKDTEEFIAQGRDKPELLAAMIARFPSSDKFRIAIQEGLELLDTVAKKQH